jgi:glutamate-5-semialdehyde dehydrogenase
LEHSFTVDKTSEVYIKSKLCKEASKTFQLCSNQEKNKILQTLSNLIVEHQEEILEKNLLDIEASKRIGYTSAQIDRLSLDIKRIEALSRSVLEVIQLEDPIGEIIETFIRPNGLEIHKKRVPLGVIAIIYESRPNVTIDASILCIKTGNSVVLRGGKEAIQTNLYLVSLIKRALLINNISQDVVQIIEDTDRKYALELMHMHEFIDVLIPRGSASLIKSVLENSTIPVIETGVGNCHIYVDASADLNMAKSIILNAKIQRPSVCNAVETVLIHKDVVQELSKTLFPALLENHVELRVSNDLKDIYPTLKLASEYDWETEYLDLILAVKTVNDFDEALLHIQKYSTHHSESIITKNQINAERFMNEIDSAALYHNASTRFTDGYEFGFEAEIGISTQKLHARGPMGLKELTSYKYLIYGNGQIR